MYCDEGSFSVPDKSDERWLSTVSESKLSVLRQLVVIVGYISNSYYHGTLVVFSGFCVALERLKFRFTP